MASAHISMVDKELDSYSCDQELRKRLRKIYAAQGIDVPAHIIEEGVAALKEDRFTYKPTPDSFAKKLAKIYVNRNKWTSRAGMKCPSDPMAIRWDSSE